MSNIIALDASFVAGRARADLLARLQRIVGSAVFEVTPDGRGLRVLGPAVPYHAHDPFLASAMTWLHPDLRIEDAPSYRRRLAALDLCLEDSWSGYFVCQQLRMYPGEADLVFIHLDHHTDMMPSLLECRGDALFDATDGLFFDVHDEQHWLRSIANGAIGIGTFVTALFYLRNRLHVRHVNHYSTSHYSTYEVQRSIRRYPEIPGQGFASVRKVPLDTTHPSGTYRGGNDPARVLADLPAGRVIVHIDLDYLINDFNGNAPDGWVPNPRDRDDAANKLDAFFEELIRRSIPVERWIVATSPGFCSAFHWRWLLERIEHLVDQLPAACDAGHPVRSS